MKNAPKSPVTKSQRGLGLSDYKIRIVSCPVIVDVTRVFGWRPTKNIYSATRVPVVEKP